MNPFSKIRLVTFDAMNTIIHLKDPVHVVYHRFAFNQGLLRFNDNKSEQIRTSFKKVYRRLSVDSPCFGFFSTSNDSPSNCNKIWWTDLVESVLIDAFPNETFDKQLLQKIAQNLYDHYRTSEPWVLEPSARSTLARLKTKGILLGVISNYDTRLRDIFKSFEIFNYFQAFALSGELGVEKPNSKIFDSMQISMRITTPDEILHVGDDYKKDYLAAKTFGWRAALVTTDDKAELIRRHQIPREDVLSNVGELVNTI